MSIGLEIINQWRSNWYGSAATTNQYTVVSPGNGPTAPISIFDMYTNMFPISSVTGKMILYIPQTSSSFTVKYSIQQNGGVSTERTFDASKFQSYHTLQADFKLNGNSWGFLFSSGVPSGTHVIFQINNIPNQWDVSSGHIMYADEWNKLVIWAGGRINKSLLVGKGGSIGNCTISAYNHPSSLEHYALGKNTSCQLRTLNLMNYLGGRSLLYNYN